MAPKLPKQRSGHFIACSFSTRFNFFLPKISEKIFLPHVNSLKIFVTFLLAQKKSKQKKTARR